MLQVQPDLEVKVKPSMHQRKLAEAKAQRMLVRDELWARRRMHDVRTTTRDHSRPLATLARATYSVESNNISII